MPNKLPQGWVECQLGEVFEIVTGKTPPKKYPEYFNGDIPFVKPGDLDKEIYITQTKDDSLTAEGLKNAPNLPKNTVLVSCIGNLGKKAILGITGSCNQQINAIIPNDYIESKYTYFYIDKIVLWLEKNASATTVKILNKGKFEQAPFLLPPLNEQKRIVEKIESEFAKIDEGLEHLENAKEQIKQYRQSVLKSALEGKLYKSTEWEETTLGQIIKPRRERISPNDNNGNMVFIGMDCIEPNSLHIHKQYRLKETKSVSFVFFKKDVLYGRMRSYLNKVWEATFDGAASAEFIVFPENQSIISSYLKYLLHQQDFVKYATRNASGDRPRVKFESDLSDYKFYLPTIKEQKRIVEEIEKRFAVADEVEKVVEQNIEKSKQLKQSILKKAFEGRLVPQDPTDEPASTLLEKIKQERSKK